MWQAFKNITINPTSPSTNKSGNYTSQVPDMSSSLDPDDQSSPDSSFAIGIDLGTTFSCVAVYKNGEPKMIGNHQFGEHLTPSIVFYDPNSTDVSVGKFADHFGIQERTNLVYDVKRLMGRKYDDVYVQSLKQNGYYSCKIVRGKDDNAEIEIKQKNKLVNKTPEEVSAEILKYLKKSASQFLGSEITEAVVSVPAHFSNAQRKATKKAAELAGLTVLKLVCEPVAAAIYYSIDKLKTKTTLLVFDFGGGTLDVSVIEVDNEKFKVKGIEGDSFLGGRDFDQKLLDYFSQDARNKILKKGDKRVDEHLRRVRKSCIKIKLQLSVWEAASIELDHFGRNEDESIPLKITRNEFEILCQDLFTRAADLITQCLNDLDLTKNDIDEVLLVGGTTRIPQICKMLELYFSPSKLKQDLNPDEAVALGAAVQAAMLKQCWKELEKYEVIDITPLTLGCSLNGGLMQVAIQKHSALPARSDVMETCTSRNNQKSCYSNIYEGERKNCKYNTLLATVSVDNLPLGKSGAVKFNKIFKLNEDGILEVEFTEISKGNKNKIVVTTHDHRLSQKKIKSSLKEAEKYKKEDELFEKLIEYRRKARKYCQHILYDLNKVLDRQQRLIVEENCNEFINYSEDVDDKNIEDLRKKFDSVKQKVDPLIEDKIKINFLLL